MIRLGGPAWLIGALCIAAASAGPAWANSYREKGKIVEVGAKLNVLPSRDWNRLDARRGKFAETWTLDGDQLNDVTFYAGVRPGSTLVRETDRKRIQLPRFESTTLLVEIPELLEGTYRAGRTSGSFTVTGSKPGRFMGRDAIQFTFEYTDVDNLPRMGEARAVLIDRKLYMVTFDAPRLHFFDRTLADFRALADSATIGR